MKRLTIILGAGGTGSYFIPSILEDYNQDFLNHKVIIWDGDVVEKRNLLRQGFYKSQTNIPKAQALFKMYRPMFKGFLEYKTTFLNYADELIPLVDEQKINFEEILLVSCVDNNMARLRLLVGQQLLKNKYPEKRILFADSGNEEWFGQTILSVMDIQDEPLIDFRKNAYTINSDFDFSHFDTIFPHVNDWKNHLTKGDHELSCDIVVESAPQNIATNMMASSVLQYTINQYTKNSKIQNIYYDCKTNATKFLARTTKENALTFLNELVSMLKSDEAVSVLSEQFLELNKDSEEIYTKKKVDFKSLLTSEEIVNDLEVISFEEIQNALGLPSKKESLESLLDSITEIDFGLNDYENKKKELELSEQLDGFDKLEKEIKQITNTRKKEKEKLNEAILDGVFEDLDSFMDTIVFKL